jgi:hypothetical protein
MVLGTGEQVAKLDGYALCRKSIQGELAAKRPLTAHASIPSQGKGNSYAQQANNRRGKVRSIVPVTDPAVTAQLLRNSQTSRGF